MTKADNKCLVWDTGPIKCSLLVTLHCPVVPGFSSGETLPSILLWASAARLHLQQEADRKYWSVKIKKAIRIVFKSLGVSKIIFKEINTYIKQGCIKVTVKTFIMLNKKIKSWPFEFSIHYKIPPKKVSLFSKGKIRNVSWAFLKDHVTLKTEICFHHRNKWNFKIYIKIENKL